MNNPPTVNFVVPQGIDNPARPSGGNFYDRSMSERLHALGWNVLECRLDNVAGRVTAPLPGFLAAVHPVAADRVAAALSSMELGSLVLVDGLIAFAPNILLNPAAEAQMALRRIVLLVHMLPAPRGAGDLLECERNALCRAVAVVTTSGWAREQVVERYGVPRERVFVVAPGSDPAPLAASTQAVGEGNSGGSLLCVAAVLPAKGHDVLINALVKLRSTEWTCNLVGAMDRDAAFTGSLRQQAMQAKIDDRLSFKGPLGRDELAREYASADILVLPSRTETYGMVITEALSRGLPVIASNIGGVPEALGHGADESLPGLLVPAGNPVALAGALRRWLSDPPLRGALREAARQRRNILAGWDASAVRMSAVLAQAAASPMPAQQGCARVQGGN